MLYAFDKDAVLLDSFDSLLDGTIHLRIDGTGNLVVAHIFRHDEARVVVDGRLLEFGLSGLETLVAIPPDIVVAGDVVVLDVGPLGFLRGAGG